VSPAVAAGDTAPGRSNRKDSAKERRGRRLRAEARLRMRLAHDGVLLSEHRGGPARAFTAAVTERLSARLEAAESSLATLSELCDEALDRLDHHDKCLKEMQDYLTRAWSQPSQAWPQPATQWHRSEAAWQYPPASWHHHASRWHYSDEQPETAQPETYNVHHDGHHAFWEALPIIEEFEIAAPNDELSSSDDEPPRNFVVGTAPSHALPSPPALGGPLPTLEEPESTSPHDDLSSSEDEPPRSFVAGTATSHSLPPLSAFPPAVMADVLSPEERHLREISHQLSSLHGLHRRTSERRAFITQTEEAASAIGTIQNAMHIIGRRGVSPPPRVRPYHACRPLADLLVEYACRQPCRVRPCAESDPHHRAVLPHAVCASFTGCLDRGFPIELNQSDR
jgi:hypothetical protein